MNESEDKIGIGGIFLLLVLVAFGALAVVYLWRFGF